MKQDKRNELVARITKHSQKKEEYANLIQEAEVNIKQLSTKTDENARMAVYNYQKIQETCTEAIEICDHIIADAEEILNEQD